jgi:hypothetical protein
MCRMSWKSGSLNPLEPAGLHRACYRTPLLIRKKEILPTQALFLNFQKAAKELAMAQRVTATWVMDETFTRVGYFTQKKILISFRFSLTTPWRHRRVEVYFPSFLPSALDGGKWLASRPGCFASGEESRYLFYRRLGGFQSRSGRE